MLSFRNNYSQTIWVCVGWFFKPDYTKGETETPCGGQPWKKEGWYQVNPGETANVLDLDLDDVNRYYVYYAESADGLVWKGPYHTLVTNYAFESCWSDPYQSNPEWRNVGFHLIDTQHYDDFTVKMIGPG